MVESSCWENMVVFGSGTTKADEQLQQMETQVQELQREAWAPWAEPGSSSSCVGSCCFAMRNACILQLSVLEPKGTSPRIPTTIDLMVETEQPLF